jgi:hypothetical protein
LATELKVEQPQLKLVMLPVGNDGGGDGNVLWVVLL